MVEMHDMVMHVLCGDHQVADQLRIRRNLVAECILDRAHRSDTMHQRAHTADALRERPGIPRIASAQDDLDAAHHGAAAGRPGDGIAIHLRFDAQMAFDAGDGIDDYLLIVLMGALYASSKVIRHELQQTLRGFVPIEVGLGIIEGPPGNRSSWSGKYPRRYRRSHVAWVPWPGNAAAPPV